MKHTLTKYAALFFIDENHIDEFLNLYKDIIGYLHFEEGLLVEQDIVHICFNLWLLIQPVSEEVMESMEKTMYYTSDFLIFDAIRKNKVFQQMKLSVMSDGIRQCQVASCLANQMNIWLIEKLGDLSFPSLFNNSNGQYYLLYKNTDLWENPVFLDEISTYTKQVTNALSDQRRFSQVFTRAMHQLDSLADLDGKIKRA